MPLCKIGVQSIEVEIGERIFGAAKISQGTIQNGAGAYDVLARLVVKGNRQLTQALQVPAQRAALRRFPPSVFERLMGIEKTPLVEESYAPLEWWRKREVRAARSWQRGPQAPSLQRNR